MGNGNLDDFWAQNKQAIGKALPKGIDALAKVLHSSAEAFGFTQKARSTSIQWMTQEGKTALMFCIVPDPRDLDRVLDTYIQVKESQSKLLDGLKQRPESKTLEFPRPWPEILSFAQRIIGIPRYLSVHSGGVVITPRPIDEYVPVERAPKGVAIIQWEKDATEEAGLVKIDLLGNRSLGVIRDAVANVRENGIDFDDFYFHKFLRFIKK